MASGEVTELLRAWRGGDATAGERVLPMIYAELRRLGVSRVFTPADYRLVDIVDALVGLVVGRGSA